MNVDGKLTTDAPHVLTDVRCDDRGDALGPLFPKPKHRHLRGKVNRLPLER